MKKSFWIISVLVISAIVVSACGASDDTVEQAPVEQLPEVEIEEAGDGSVPVEEQPAEPAPVEVSFPAWYSTPLTDVNTGAVFTIEENLGKVILVETLATWCSNCFKQQTEVAKLHNLMGERDDWLQSSRSSAVFNCAGLKP